VFDQSWSGSYARAGYLKTLVRRRARILRTGAAQRGGWVAHSPCARAREVATLAALMVARARPGSRRHAVGDVEGGSVQGRGLPAERGELAGAGDRDDTSGLATLAGEGLPALV